MIGHSSREVGRDNLILAGNFVLLISNVICEQILTNFKQTPFSDAYRLYCFDCLISMVFVCAALGSKT